jgi:hypothetical protein
VPAVREVITREIVQPPTPKKASPKPMPKPIPMIMPEVMIAEPAQHIIYETVPFEAYEMMESGPIYPQQEIVMPLHYTSSRRRPVQNSSYLMMPDRSQQFYNNNGNEAASAMAQLQSQNQNIDNGNAPGNGTRIASM